MKHQPHKQQDELDDLSRQIAQMEQALQEAYCDLGKSVLEIAELEGRKANLLVDAIVQKRRLLCALQNQRGPTSPGAENADEQEDMNE